MTRHNPNIIPSPKARMTPLRRVAIIRAIDDGRLGLERARVDYALSDMELKAWRDAYYVGGIDGLRLRWRVSAT